MSKPQIALLFFALLLILGMYQLPKVVLEDDQQNLKSQQDAPPQGDKMPQNHSLSLPPLQQALLDTLKKNLAASENLEKKITFADSIAKLYQKLNVFDSASNYYIQIAELAPSIDHWKQAGNAAYSAFEFYAVVDAAKSANFKEKAQSFYQKILDQQPEDLDTQARMAMTQLSSQNPMQGILKLREIAEKDPKNEFVLLNLGLLSMQTKQYDKAKSRFEQLLSVNPNNNQAKILLSQCLVELKMKEKAIALLQEIVQTENDSVLRSSAEEYLKTLKK
ncbi:MAG: tetratricopeptide repeat protein [Microscillaceae bacterium]|nr:tetratricopeptide repeat protein [Microscillaceae bacterium]